MPVGKHIFDSLPDPVVILDDERVFVCANLAARELLGCRAEGGDLALSVRHPLVLGATGRLRKGAGDVW